ncbi:hypothetical protein TanjilG_04469 [Lupinus angustifolius]|uniref:Uncharacterized protein n=1 Tax=Lupinus angustifolius TaxID=3871 RepID=A0A4P1RPV7_LUPAN|nr:hypothetical protein TanjilG_04469 [Lupinus angustifolius]
MRLTGTGTSGYMGLEPKQIAFERDSDLFDEDKSYSSSLHFLGLANGCLAFWLLLVASSYLDLSTTLNFFCTCRSKTVEKVSLTVRTISNARTEKGATASNSHHECDAYSEISDFDKTSYFDALLSLEDEDTEWLSYIGSPSYWDSLLNLEEEKDSDKDMYFDSLLSLEDEDNGWLSDSFENPSTPLSYKCDFLSEISDIDSPNYWSSLLKLEEKDNDEPLFWPFEEENFASNNDHSIETLLGLNEFDGHEGLDSEFNIFGDDFMLD